MDFEVQVAHSVNEIGQEAWDSLGGQQPFASYRWYRFGEKLWAKDTPIYIVLSLQDKPVARATFWLKNREPMPISSKPLRKLIKVLLRRWPLLLCQSPVASTSGLILPDQPLREAAIRTISRVVQEQARRHRVSFMGFVYLEQDQADPAEWPAPFAATELPGPGTRLNVKWPDFDSYLQSLSKSMRKDYRRHRNRAADLGIEIRRHTSIADKDVEKAMQLIRGVEQHHNAPPNTWARPALENAEIVQSTWLTAEVDERLVGCGLLLGDRDTHFMALLGLDYDVRYTYFQLVYAALDAAIEQGVQVLRGGNEAYKMKRRLGFELETNNYAVFAGRGKLLQKLGRWAAGS